MRTGIFGLVDHAHAALTEFFENAVVRDRLPEERVGVRHSAVILGCVSKVSRRSGET